MVFDKCSDSIGEFADARMVAAKRRKGFTHQSERAQFCSHGVLGLFVGPLFPEQDAAGSGRRRVAEQPSRQVNRQQRTQQQRTVPIVDTLRISFRIPRPHEALDRFQSPAFRERSKGWHRVGTQQDAAPFKCLQDAPCEKLNTADVFVLGHDLLIPDFTGFQELWISDLFEEIGAGEVKEHRSIARHDGKFQLLRIGGESMVTQADDIGARFEQFLPVFQLADRILAQGLQSRMDITSLYRIAQLLQLLDDVPHLLDHQIRGEVTIDIADGLEAFQTMANAVEHAVGGLCQRACTTIARLQQ